MINKVDVRNTVTVDNSKRPSAFFDSQKPDADAAYQRLAITKKTLKMYQREINDTNTTDIKGDLKELYINLEYTMNMIIAAEQQLIFNGE